MSSASPIGIDPPAALTRRVHAAVSEQRTTTWRPRLRNLVALMVASSASIGVIAAASQLVYGDQALGLRAGVKSTFLLVSVALALLASLFASTFAALSRSRSGLGASTSLLIAVTSMTVPLYALLTLALPVHEGATTVGSVGVSPWGARCFVIASLVGVLVLGCFALAMRTSVPVGTRLRSVVLGSAAGAWAGLAVFAFCPSGDTLHLSVGHVLPVVALTLVGAVTLPTILRP